METDRVRAPNIRDVARLAGVSYQTVSRVLNDSASIRAQHRQRVLEVIEELGYRPNQAARALVTSKSRMIGVLGAAGRELRRGDHPVRDRGCRPRSRLHDRHDQRPATTSRSRRTSISSIDQAVEGLVVVAPQVRVFDAIRPRGPRAVRDARLERRDVPDSMSVDQFEGRTAATRHLIELGHREIIHIAGPQDWIEAEARMQGYLREVADAESGARPPVLGDWTAEFGYRAGLELLRRPRFHRGVLRERPDGARPAARVPRAGLACPATSASSASTTSRRRAHYWPPLTTIRQDFAEIGRRAVELLLAEINGGGAPTPGGSGRRSWCAARPRSPGSPDRKPLSGRYPTVRTANLTWSRARSSIAV